MWLTGNNPASRGVTDGRYVGVLLHQRAIVVGLLICLGVAPHAQEVSIVLPPEAEDLRAALDAASLTTSLKDAGPTTAQDYVAAARADYRRILTGL